MDAFAAVGIMGRQKGDQPTVGTMACWRAGRPKDENRLLLPHADAQIYLYKMFVITLSAGLERFGWVGDSSLFDSVVTLISASFSGHNSFSKY